MNFDFELIYLRINLFNKGERKRMEEMDIRGKRENPCWMYNSSKELERNKEERKSLDTDTGTLVLVRSVSLG